MTPAAAGEWMAPHIRSAVEDSKVFWKETPAVTPEAPPLAIAHGLDPAAPLSTWLTAEDHQRVRHAAKTVGLDPSSLEPLRPWLGAQLLQQAAESRNGLRTDLSPDVVLPGLASELGIPIASEYETLEAVIRTFAGFPRAAEVEYLGMVLDEIDQGVQGAVARAQAWMAGDLELEEREVHRIRAIYPGLHSVLIADRNKAWVPRVEELVATQTPSFILVGTAHMVGPDSVPARLAAMGLQVHRV
jgi:uncharacterized protein YbaP (TraB family)